MADMNVSPARPGLTPVIWQSDFWVEYLRENQFSVYFDAQLSRRNDSVAKTDLTRKRGDRVVFPTVRSLVGAGVTGNVILEGNEEVINARPLQVVVGVIRHAGRGVRTPGQAKALVIDLLQCRAPGADERWAEETSCAPISSCRSATDHGGQ